METQTMLKIKQAVLKLEPNPNHPRRGDSIRVEPIRKQKDINLIKATGGKKSMRTHFIKSSPQHRLIWNES